MQTLWISLPTRHGHAHLRRAAAAIPGTSGFESGSGQKATQDQIVFVVGQIFPDLLKIYIYIYIHLRVD